VVLPDNIQDIERVQNFAREQGIPVHFSPAVLTGSYFNNLENAEEIGFVPESEKGRQAQVAFHKLSAEDDSALRFYYDDMARMLDGAPRSRTCLMGYFGCVVEHTGEVYPCPIWEYESFGNMLEQSFEDIWFSERAQAARHNLRRTGCPTCSSMCYPHAVGLNEVLHEKAMNVQRKARRVAGRLLKV
ncbi:MAG: SPASM domain-containing protein, partial [Roseiflexaceae bacterium]